MLNIVFLIFPMTNQKKTRLSIKTKIEKLSWGHLESWYLLKTQKFNCYINDLFHFSVRLQLHNIYFRNRLNIQLCISRLRPTYNIIGILMIYSIFLCDFSCISMTSLLMHTVSHSTRPSYRPKTNNQPLKQCLSLSVSWVKVVKNTKFWLSNSIF